MSSYEAKRQAQIAKNAELLQSLGIKRPIGGSDDSDSGASKPKPAKKAKKVVKAEPTAPSRSSSRLKRLAVDSEEAERLREEDKREEEEKRALVERTKHETRFLKALSAKGVELADEQSEALKTALKGMTGQRWPRAEIAEAIENAATASSKKGKAKANKVPVDSQLQEAIDSLEMMRLEKIVPDRIYSLVVHPSVEKELVFAGDKSGHLGVWDVWQEQPEAGDDDEDEDEEPKTRAFWTLKQHSKSSISALGFSPVDGHSLFSASYDCTIRRINLESGQSEEVMDADAVAREVEGRNEALVSSFDLSGDGHTLWASDNRGGILHRDLREKPSSVRRWIADSKKVGCISLNPANENIVATAHLARDVRLFDVRALLEMESNEDWEDVNDKAQLASYTHGLACSSAYWNPTGRHLLSTSYDNVCRVWDVDPAGLLTPPDPFEPAVSAPHDNQTGRFVSVFKSRWSPNPTAPPHWSTGSMEGQKALDIYSADGALIRQLIDSRVTAIPAVTCHHPSKLARLYGANASGKVAVWAPADS